MNKQEKEKRCLVCKKQLIIDKKIPLCSRCRLEGRNKVAPILPAIGGIIFAITTKANTEITNNSEETDKTQN